MKVHIVNKDAIIYFEGTVPQNIYLLKKGKVRLELTENTFLVNGQLKKSKTIESGEVFGYEEYFAGQNMRSRGVALEKSEIVYFEPEEFVRLLKENITLGEKIVFSLIERIKELNNKLKEISIRTKDTGKEENIVDIYSYFFNSGEMKIADEILSRIESSDLRIKLEKQAKKSDDNMKYNKENIRENIEKIEQEIQNLTKEVK